MKLISLFSITFLGLSQIFSQKCGNTEEYYNSIASSIQGFNSLLTGCENWADYFVSEESNTPIKTIRVTFHIFRSADGTQGLHDSPAVRNYINIIASDINNERFSDLDPYNKPSTSPYYDDARIRIQIQNIYFWPNDTGWNYQHASGTYANTMWNWIQSQSIAYKTTSLHILSGNYNNTDVGYAPIVPNPGSDQIVFYPDLDNKYADGNAYQPATTIAHEIGHTLSLQHPWLTSNGCPATDLNRCSTNGCSNNIMNYAGCCALTVCQIHKMHAAIWNNYFSIGDYVASGASSSDKKTPIIIGPGCVSTTGQTFEVSNYTFGAKPAWTASPTSKLISSSGCGPKVDLVSNNSSNSGTGSMTFTMTYGSTDKSNSRTFTFSEGITGTVISGGTTTPLGISHAVTSTSVSANIDAPGATTFSWVKTSGSGSWYTYNNGKSLSLTLTTGGQISFNISTATSSCGALSKNVTFFHVGGYYSFYPNPVENELFVEVDKDQIQFDAIDDYGNISTVNLKLGIDKLSIFDKEGNLLKEQKMPNESKSAKINLNGLKSDVYIVIVQDKDRYIDKTIVKI